MTESISVGSLEIEPDDYRIVEVENTLADVLEMRVEMVRIRDWAQTTMVLADDDLSSPVIAFIRRAFDTNAVLRVSRDAEGRFTFKV